MHVKFTKINTKHFQTNTAIGVLNTFGWKVYQIMYPGNFDIQLKINNWIAKNNQNEQQVYFIQFSGSFDTQYEGKFEHNGNIYHCSYSSIYIAFKDNNSVKEFKKNIIDSFNKKIYIIFDRYEPLRNVLNRNKISFTGVTSKKDKSLKLCAFFANEKTAMLYKLKYS